MAYAPDQIVIEISNDPKTNEPGVERRQATAEVINVMSAERRRKNAKG